MAGKGRIAVATGLHHHNVPCARLGRDSASASSTRLDHLRGLLELASSTPVASEVDAVIDVPEVLERGLRCSLGDDDHGSVHFRRRDTKDETAAVAALFVRHHSTPGHDPNARPGLGTGPTGTCQPVTQNRRPAQQMLAESAARRPPTSWLS